MDSIESVRLLEITYDKDAFHPELDAFNTCAEMASASVVRVCFRRFGFAGVEEQIALLLIKLLAAADADIAVMDAAEQQFVESGMNACFISPRLSQLPRLSFLHSHSSS
jgi:hypothetical protein